VGEEALGTSAFTQPGSAGSAGFHSISQPEGSELTNQEKIKFSLTPTGTLEKGPS